MIFQLLVSVAIVAIAFAVENEGQGNVFIGAISKFAGVRTQTLKTLSLQGSLPVVHHRPTGFLRFEFSDGNCETFQTNFMVSYPLGVCTPNIDTGVVANFVVTEVGESVTQYGYTDNQCLMPTGEVSVTDMPTSGCQFSEPDDWSYSAFLDDARLPHVLSFAKKVFAKPGCKGAHADIYWPSGSCMSFPETQDSMRTNCEAVSDFKYSGNRCLGDVISTTPYDTSKWDTCRDASVATNTAFAGAPFFLKARCGGKLGFAN